MTEIEAKKALNNILDDLGVQTNDCIMLGIDMGKLPLPNYKAELSHEAFREREQKWCQFVLDVLLDKVGDQGTIIVPTFTYSYGAPGSVFNVQTSPSENGPFTEFIRSHQLAYRSIHPVFSLAAIGKDANELTNNAGRSAFGVMSPFARFENFDVRFLCLGVELRNSITYIHHLEQNYGCPHRYNKTFDVTVISENEKLEGEWYSYVDYRSTNYSSDISSLQDALQKTNDLNCIEWNHSMNHLVGIKAVNKVGYDLLNKNSCAFVDRNMKFIFTEDSENEIKEKNEIMLKIKIKEI